MSSKNNISGGVDFFSLLTVLFICLKLTGDIDWSWWWVMSPMWMPISIVISICAVYVVVKSFSERW